MPFPIALAGPLIQGSSGLMDQINTERVNREQQRYNEKWYNRQLGDNINLWRMQNEYNTPAQQMQRFREAGLNPALMYSQGNPGNAVQLSRPDLAQTQFRTSPQSFGDVGRSTLDSIYDIQLKQAQVDNLRAQNSVIKQDALLKSALTRSTLTGEQQKKFDLDFNTEMRGVSADYAREKNRNLKVQTDYTIDRNVREALMNTSNLKEAVSRMETMKLQRAKTIQEINNIKQQTRILQQDETIKSLEIDLRKAGINPNDPTYIRILGRVLTDFFDGNMDLKTPSILDFFK